MTDSTRTLRGRRAPRFEDVPPDLAAWFAGEIADTLLRLLPNEDTLLPTRWKSYRTTHPHAVAPDGYAWLSDETDPRQPTKEQVAEARKLLARSR